MLVHTAHTYVRRHPFREHFQEGQFCYFQEEGGGDITFNRKKIDEKFAGGGGEI